MEYNIKKEGDIFAIYILGDLVAGKIFGLKKEIEEILEKERPKVLFNFSDVNFIDSSGIGLVINCLRKLSEKKGQLKLCNLNKTIINIFKQIRIHSFLEIYDSFYEALDSFEK
jgi:anti-sigma B factor antagonist